MPAATAEADDVDLPGLDDRDGFRKRPFVSRQTIRIVARGRMCFVEREPFLGLLDAIVVEFVIHLPRAQRY